MKVYKFENMTFLRYLVQFNQCRLQDSHDVLPILCTLCIKHDISGKRVSRGKWALPLLLNDKCVSLTEATNYA